MRAAALALAVILLPAPAMAQEDGRVTCLSNDGQVRVEFADGAVDAVTLRVPADAGREARTWRLAVGAYRLEVLSEGRTKARTEGCAGVPGGTVAILRTSLVGSRRIRLVLMDSAVPEGMTGRTTGGDGLERDLTCTEVRTGMAKCP